VYSLLAKNYTFVVPHGKFLKKKDKNGKKWDGTIKLFNFKTGLIYKGLVGDVKDLLLDSDAGDIDLVNFGKNPGIHNGFDIDYIKSLNIPDRYTPRAFAVEAAHQALKQTRATVESPTSSGKSMIIYYMVRRIIDSYLDEKRKVLIVVPSITLVDQMEGDFVDYGYKDDIWKIPGADVKHADIIVSTWQSLQNKPDEFFEDFDAVFVDEAHGATATDGRRMGMEVYGRVV
jgi:superfamily II DNA or RNA helicase